LVRILSGDHRETVLACANACGVDHESNGFTKFFKEMSGAEFAREMADRMIEVRDPVTGNWTYVFKTDSDKLHFHTTVANTIIMHRASPVDKQMFIAGLKEIGCSVAYTGDGPSDATSLYEADVGMCIGGCDVAKDKADIIIRDGNFSSVSNAAKWGRNIHDNIKRFLQFQLTVNISLVLIVFIGSLTLGLSPFTVMQLLWINLVMDALAAIALSTEAPHPTELGPIIEPELRELQILPIMWRTIFTQVCYQFITLVVLLYAGPTMFGIKYNLVNEPVKWDNGLPTARMQHYTMLFHTFVLMNTFNLINCRVIGSEDQRELNIFRRLYTNWFFPVIFLGILNF